MTPERRYTDDEVRAIFGAASAHSSEAAPATDLERGGADLTLGELKQIAVEVGLDPERVSSAAVALDADGDAGVPTLRPGRAVGDGGSSAELAGLSGGAALTPDRRTRLGSPVAISRVVELPRAPTDAEWHLLVGEMRQMFGARGTLTESGSMRDWSNGNLHASVEPTQSGYRLRMATRKGSAAEFEATGLFTGAFGLLMAILLAVTGEVEGALMIGAILGGTSAIFLGGNAVSLPRWARERQGQFDRLGERARALLDEGEGGESGRK